MNRLSRLSNAFRASALVLAALVAVVTVDTTRAIAHHQSGALHQQLVAAAAAPASRSGAQVRS
jgi:hypothetical protein